MVAIQCLHSHSHRQPQKLAKMFYVSSPMDETGQSHTSRNALFRLTIVTKKHFPIISVTSVSTRPYEILTVLVFPTNSVPFIMACVHFPCFYSVFEEIFNPFLIFFHSFIFNSCAIHDSFFFPFKVGTQLLVFYIQFCPIFLPNDPCVAISENPLLNYQLDRVSLPPCRSVSKFYFHCTNWFPNCWRCVLQNLSCNQTALSFYDILDSFLLFLCLFPQNLLIIHTKHVETVNVRIKLQLEFLVELKLFM